MVSPRGACAITNVNPLDSVVYNNQKGTDDFYWKLSFEISRHVMIVFSLKIIFGHKNKALNQN